MQTVLKPDTWYHNECYGQHDSYYIKSPIEELQVINGGEYAGVTVNGKAVSTVKTPKYYYPLPTSKIVDRFISKVNKPIIINTTNYANTHRIFIPAAEFSSNQSVLTVLGSPEVSVKTLSNIQLTRESLGRVVSGILIINSYTIRHALQVYSGLMRIICTNMDILAPFNGFGDNYFSYQKMRHSANNDIVFRSLLDQLEETYNAFGNKATDYLKYYQLPKEDREEAYFEFVEDLDSPKIAEFFTRVYEKANNALDIRNIASYMLSHTSRASMQRYAETVYEIFSLN